ncbi:MAG: phosphate starvation-inducible protein PhoH, partial [Morganella morganii]
RRFRDDDMVSVVSFTQDDCVRSSLCLRALQAYN